jgi:hypothetical protein
MCSIHIGYPPGPHGPTHWGWTLLRSKACNKFQSWHVATTIFFLGMTHRNSQLLYLLSIYLSIYLYTWGWCFCSDSHLKIARCGRYIITGSKYQPKQKDTGFSRYDSPNMRWFDTLSCHLWSPNMGGVIHPNLNVTNKKKDDLYRSYVLCKWWHTHFPC